MRETSKSEVILGPLCAEFNLMEDCLEEPLLNTLLSHFLKCIIDGLLTLFDIFQLYPLHPHRKRGLLSCMIIPGPRAEVGCDPGLNDLLIKRGIRPVEQQRREDLHREALVGVL
jgi:hypothetical protein